MDQYYAYYAFLFILFYTGLRPSEAVALWVKSVELATGTLFIERSRSLRSEGEPKTAVPTKNSESTEKARVLRIAAVVSPECTSPSDPRSLCLPADSVAGRLWS